MNIEFSNTEMFAISAVIDLMAKYQDKEVVLIIDSPIGLQDVFRNKFYQELVAAFGEDDVSKFPTQQAYKNITLCNYGSALVGYRFEAAFVAILDPISKMYEDDYIDQHLRPRMSAFSSPIYLLKLM